MAPTDPSYKEIAAQENFLGNGGGRSTSRRPKSSTILLSLSTFFFAFLSLYFALESDAKCVSTSFKNGYTIEWGPAKAGIKMQKVIYTGAFRYNATSDSYYREFDPAMPQYVGFPNPEIDKAWRDLLAGQYLAMNEEEVKDLDDPVPIDGIYLGEVEVMHSLHCLNAIRKEIHWDYYSLYDEHPLPDELRRIHIDHCFEQLRQNIQYASDLTPVMVRPYGKAPNITYIGTPQIHTCRNWEYFRQWYTDRGHAYGSINGGGT